MKAQQRTLNIQYALLQGFHWMGFGAAFSFAAVYLQYRGYSNSVLGLILGAANIAGFALAPLLAQAVDRRGRGCLLRILWLMMAVQICVLVVFRLTQGGVLLSVCYCLYLTYYICANPLLTQLCSELEHSFGHVNYGAARGIGSLGYALFVAVLGSLVSRLSPSMLPFAGLFTAVLQSSLLLILSLRLKSAGERSAEVESGQEKSLSLPKFIAENKRFFIMLIGVALLFFSHNLLNNFLINIVRNVGGNEKDMGGVNGFMALMELPAMLLYDRLLRRVSCPATIRIAAAAFVIKGLCIALAPNLPALYGAHVFQAFSFALITPALVRYVELYIDRKDSAKGQSVSAAMSSLGAIFASSLGGLMFDHMSVSGTLMMGAAAAAVGAAICTAFSAPEVKCA